MKIENSLREKLTQKFHPSQLEIENESHLHSRGKEETHFKVLIVSEKFQGMSRVDRQREIMALFDEERSQGLHALSLRALTPDEVQKSQSHFVSPACSSKTSRSF
ncbi:MAG: BolA family transcriptional regulator [Proteobacteria bacterium]|jgi:BolA protein|nr:BolA family transcriptional regulator [Pseudomonadota bacterium]